MSRRLMQTTERRPFAADPGLPRTLSTGTSAGISGDRMHCKNRCGPLHRLGGKKQLKVKRDKTPSDKWAHRNLFAQAAHGMRIGLWVDMLAPGGRGTQRAEDVAFHGRESALGWAAACRRHRAPRSRHFTISARPPFSVRSSPLWRNAAPPCRSRFP